MARERPLAAIGLAIRAAGAGKRVVFAQFFKDGSSSEISVLKAVGNIQAVHCNTVRGFWKRMDDVQKAKASKDYTSFFAEIIVLVKFADYVSEIKKVKHPYDCGIAAREGIEF